MKCNRPNCHNPAVTFLVNSRSLKICVLKDIEEENPPFGAPVYCKKHSNSYTAPFGWDLRREVRVFAEYEIERERAENAEKNLLRKPIANNHPAHNKKFPDDDLTRIMHAVKKKRHRTVPENMQGTRNGNLIAIRRGVI